MAFFPHALVHAQAIGDVHHFESELSTRASTMGDCLVFAHQVQSPEHIHSKYDLKRKKKLTPISPQIFSPKVIYE